MSAPVIQLETLHAILAMAVTKDLQIKQMDVKGTYLNGVLKETVYMKQPEGYEDGTERSCLLVKMLYGLKPARCKWNKELDAKLDCELFLLGPYWPICDHAKCRWGNGHDQAVEGS